MSYKILSRRTEQTVFTTVEYDFDGQIVVVEVAHFMPESEESIVAGIKNRAVSEQNRLLSEVPEVS